MTIFMVICHIYLGIQYKDTVYDEHNSICARDVTLRSKRFRVVYSLPNIFYFSKRAHTA